MKYCKKCDLTLPLTSFTVATSRYDGLQAYCSDCMKSYRREHYHANKQPYIDRSIATKQLLKEYVWELKKAPCVDCSATYPDEPWLMEFDHIGFDKTANVAELVRQGSLRKLKEEILKCELVCIVCHRRRTAKRAGWTTEKYVVY